MMPHDFLYLNLAHDYDAHDKLFFCDENQSPLENIPWLILKSDTYFAPSFFMIPRSKQELVKLFPNREIVFHLLGRYLFHPSNQVWGLITRFHNAYISNANKLLGIQIRVLEGGTHPLQHVMDQILNCTLEQNLLPELDLLGSEAPAKENQSSVAVLVTSLYLQYYQNLKTMYWTRTTKTGELVSFHQPSHEEYQKFGNDLHNMKAWTEMYLLSLSDVLVTSAWSTFGYVAQGLGGKRPWILYKPLNQKTPDPSCRQGMSMEPCFHAPPAYDCEANVGREIVSVVSHVMQCEDVSWGVKLFNDNVA